MKERVRSFLVFTTVGYRILAFAVVPLLCMAAGWLVVREFGIPGYFISAFLLTMAEVMLDFMVFGGICAKEVSHLDYLKGSRKGEKIIRYALTGSMVRMLLTGVLVFAVNEITYRLLGTETVSDSMIDVEQIVIMLILLIASYAATMGMIIIGRFFDGLHIYYLLSMAATALVAGVLILLMIDNWYLILGIVTAAAVVFSILSERLALKHIKESYYDKTVSDGN